VLLRLLNRVLFVSGAYYLGSALNMVRGLVLARLLGPAAFGVWSAMRLSQTLVMTAHLGSRQGMVQLVPRASAAADHASVARLQSATAGLHVLAAAFTAVGVAGLGLLSDSNRLEWVAFGVVLFAAQLFFFFHALARSRRQFVVSSGAEILIAAVSTLGGLVAAWRFGLFGFLVVLAGAYLCGAIVIRLAGMESPRPTLGRDAVRDVLRAGFPLMASEGLFILLWNIDKLLLWLLGSSAELGVYALQSSFTGLALLAPSALATVLHPHLRYRLGATGTSDSVTPYLVRGTALVAACSAPVAAFGTMVLHLPIRWLLPAYGPAIEPGRILMIAAYFSMMATVPTVVTSVLDGQAKLCLIRGTAIAVAVAGGVWGLRDGYMGLALAIGLALAADGLWTLHEASRRAGVTGQKRGELWLRAAFPLLLVLGPVALAWQLFPSEPGTVLGDLATTCVRASIAVLPSLAWATWLLSRLQWRTGGGADAPTSATFAVDEGL
jgi:O-antigen/teichoic acid export membrane protein